MDVEIRHQATGSQAGHETVTVAITTTAAQREMLDAALNMPMIQANPFFALGMQAWRQWMDLPYRMMTIGSLPARPRGEDEGA